MEFKEENYIDIPKIQNVFIYFLIKDDEVVYVGQTRNGLLRPLAHKNKDYDHIKIIYCKEEELNALENNYILKYTPKYNKMVDYAFMYGLSKCIKSLKKEGIYISIHMLRQIISLLNIKIIVAENYEAIYVIDYYKILKYLKGV